MRQDRSSGPISCRLLDDEQRKCAFGSCDARTLDRLRKECVRDGGWPRTGATAGDSEIAFH
jgi:hypothetical protein